MEDLKPGRYKAQLSANGTTCRFELSVPEAKGPLTDLGETVCEPANIPAPAAMNRSR